MTTTNQTAPKVTQDAASVAWTSGNDAGNGFAPDGPDGDESIEGAVDQAIEDGGEIVLRASNTSEVSVVRTSAGQLIAIGGDGSGNGAWAVDISALEVNTFAEWLAAAGRVDSASEYDLRAAWRAGESPSDYEVK